MTAPAAFFLRFRMKKKTAIKASSLQARSLVNFGILIPVPAAPRAPAARSWPFK
jgi:hypothetical protein